jgi:ADP-heptose:LPS heptosyltransferase
VRRLVIRPGAIGDTIVSLPALERLCSAESGAGYAEIWAPSRNLPLVRHIAPVRSFPSVQLDLLEIDPPPALIEKLRSFDEIVSWYGAAREEFASALQSVGVPFRLLRALPSEGSGCHAVDFYLKQAGFAAAATLKIAPRLPVPRRSGTGKNEFIAIHPFSGGRKKNWDLAAFQAAAARLTELAGLPCEWCAGPEEELPGARRFEGLDEVARWLSGAALYLGNDSGISHLAAACGVPSVVIFSVTDASVWSPRGPEVAVLQTPDLAQVVETAMALLRADSRR